MYSLYSDRATGEMPHPQGLSVFACRIRHKLHPHARITRNPIGLALRLAPGVEMDWSCGISPVARLSAKWARQGGD